MLLWNYHLWLSICFIYNLGRVERDLQYLMASVQPCSSIPTCPFENLIIFVLKLLFPNITEHWFLLFSKMNPFPRDFTCQSILITSSCCCSSKCNASIQKDSEVLSSVTLLDRKHHFDDSEMWIRRRYFQYANLLLTEIILKTCYIIWPSLSQVLSKLLFFSFFYFLSDLVLH